MGNNYKNRKGHGDGVIRLIHNDKVLRCDKYLYLSHLKKIIRLWRNIYGEAIRKAEISIMPNI